MPEGDLVGGEVDLVGDIVPFVGFELGFPFALAAYHPLPMLSIQSAFFLVLLNP